MQQHQKQSCVSFIGSSTLISVFVDFVHINHDDTLCRMAEWTSMHTLTKQEYIQRGKEHA